MHEIIKLKIPPLLIEKFKNQKFKNVLWSRVSLAQCLPRVFAD